MMQVDLKNGKDLEQYCRYILHHSFGKDYDDCTAHDKYKAMAFAIRSELLERYLETKRKNNLKKKKRVYYLSLEFLMGRFLRNAADNVNMEELSRSAVKGLGLKMEELYEEESDAGLGNGGLGRLAACFLDSMATMDIPGTGFGIRYEYGMFNQDIADGWQIEHPDNWLYKGFPWEIPRLDYAVKVKFYGRTRPGVDEKGNYKVEWVGGDEILAVPYDVLIPGYGTRTVNRLTLWSAKATEDFNLAYFNQGDYIKAVEQKDYDENISKVLYPVDNFILGRELRLKQEYFFVSASLQEIIQIYLKSNKDFSAFPDKVAIQLNDTHPTVGISELMRLLVDEHRLDWDEAWDITTRTFAFTNHTLMPEALEKWKLALFGSLLPRNLEIIYEINSRFLDEVRKKFPGDDRRVRDMSIIEEGEEKKVRMAYLAIVGSHSVNGVANLHTELLKKTVLSDFYDMWPEKFNNKTNGVTQRRWLKQANPSLSYLITKYIGDKWVKDLYQIKEIEKFASDKDFCAEWDEVKLCNKKILSEYLKKEFGFAVDPESMFDIQVKRIHEYKRQLLNVLGVIAQYLRIKDNPKGKYLPRTVMIGGKAAPGYYMAKLIIKLVNDVAEKINNDPVTSKYLKLFFLPNYRVSFAEKIFPASELSEQISTAGTEASGTGNMKFALNGALTIGTLDGANIEIKDAVGDDNIFIFGMNAEEVAALKGSGYNPMDYYNSNPLLKKVIDSIKFGHFSPDAPDRFSPIVDNLLSADQYMLLADFDSYVNCHDVVDKEYRNRKIWTKKSIINVANMGFFSSDRTIGEYAREIWGVL